MLGLAKQLKTSAQNQGSEGGLSEQTKSIHIREDHRTKIKERGTEMQTLRNENTIDFEGELRTTLDLRILKGLGT